MTPTSTPLPRYPRISELLARAEENPAQHGSPGGGTGAGSTDGHGAAAPAGGLVELTKSFAMDAPLTFADELPSLAEAVWDGKRSEAGLGDDEVDDLIASLGMRDIAREALRARLLAIGAQREQRTTYELVFLMLAFAVMVMIVSPPLVQLAQALHGTHPG